MIQQFYLESLMVSFAAILLALGIASYTLPWINTLADKHLMVPWKQPLFWGGLVIITCITALFSGSYPAIYLSAFKPMVLIAIFVAIPVAWYFSAQWLQNFDYSIMVSWWIFALTP